MLYYGLLPMIYDGSVHAQLGSLGIKWVYVLGFVFGVGILYVAGFFNVHRPACQLSRKVFSLSETNILNSYNRARYAVLLN
jgi:hypothetical protein